MGVGEGEAPMDSVLVGLGVKDREGETLGEVPKERLGVGVGVGVGEDVGVEDKLGVEDGLGVGVKEGEAPVLRLGVGLGVGVGEGVAEAVAVAIVDAVKAGGERLGVNEPLPVLLPCCCRCCCPPNDVGEELGVG